MRSKYIQFILDNKLSDILSEVYELSYSQKLLILEELLKKYSEHTINIALYVYKKEYIDLNRVKILLIKNTLKNICERKRNDNQS
jgi:hypothetical protein